MASSSLQQMALTLVTRSKTMVNTELKRILREEGMATSGVKAHLQLRVIELIDRAVGNNDHNMFNRLQHRIANRGAPPPSSSTALAATLPAPQSAAHLNGRAMSNGYTPQAHAGYQMPLQDDRPTNHFKKSPFYEIRELLLQNITLEISPNHRQTRSSPLVLSEAVCARLRSEPSLRILLFSCIDQPLAQYTRADVAFPSQIEVRVNGGEVRANFKGLKNKPGSTRPADITPLVRTQPVNYRNTLLITYALTQKESPQEKYNVFVYMVKTFTVEQLAQGIAERNVITKKTVLDEMREKANDPDIVVESSVMSLKDPISTLKMTIPCRSTICTHNRCFDAESFLQLQEQAPTWVCPICNKTISYDALVVDEYVQEILQKVSKDTDQVTIEPDGRWFKEPAASASRNNSYHDDDDDSGSDLVEVSDFRVSAIKSEAVSTPQLSRTPPMPSREPSSAPRTGTKRTSEVIDLTLSDDDEPPRPAKKVAYNTPNSLPDPSRRYQMPSLGSSSLPRHPQAQSHHSIPSGLRMDPPSHRHSYNPYQPPPPRQYPGRESPSYPTYIGSSP
ncbi:E3 SUMO-protein ligase PIAS1 [Massarina eburnea CBS 473.64]|uniref:E3 SUMO-protein ligase PIAS1 n=1 Tax=Massarina eburnea CBS 473.64 TaxID=1395130 RepID=A0A6A6RU65_9PLEO|nr:E3 SUMO-protein ligase PIAS1 [Massarina eburnea CBS 473.64]